MIKFYQKPNQKSLCYNLLKIFKFLNSKKIKGQSVIFPSSGWVILKHFNCEIQLKNDWYKFIFSL